MISTSKLLNVIFNMILVKHLLSRAVFYRFYDFLCWHCSASGTRLELKWIYFFLLKRCYLFEKKRFYRFKSQLLNFPSFSLVSCLAVAYVLTYILASALSNSSAYKKRWILSINTPRLVMTNGKYLEKEGCISHL